MRSLIVILVVSFPIVRAATCTSDQYCPRGWAVKRIGKEYAAMTCEPTDPSRKCPKPYTCVASHCQINFCCANQKLLERLASEEENEENDGEEWAEDEL